MFSCTHLCSFFLREVSNFYFKQNKQLLYYEKTALYSYLNVSKHLSGAISQNSSEWSLLKVPQQIKTYQKSTAKKILELLQLMLFECFYNIFFKSVTESVFSKVSGLSCKQHIQQVCAGLL